MNVIVTLIIFGIPALILWGLGIYSLVLLIKALKIYIKKNNFLSIKIKFLEKMNIALF